MIEISALGVAELAYDVEVLYRLHLAVDGAHRAPTG